LNSNSMGTAMIEFSDKATFSVLGKDYVFQPIQGEVKDIEVQGKELQLVLETDQGEITCRAPWYAEVKKGHVLTAVTGREIDGPEEQTVYYLYDNDTEGIEVNTKFGKPNKNFLYALLDFGLVILSGILIAPLIVPLVKDNKLLAFATLVGLILGIYVVVYLATYRLAFRRELDEIGRINSYLKQKAQSLVPG